MLNYRRFLKRKNISANTIRNYMNRLKHFVVWVSLPLEDVTSKEVQLFVDYLLDKGLAAVTINCHLISIRGFYNYLEKEEGLEIINPVKKGYALRLPKPLPRYLRDEEVELLFKPVKSCRDRAMFMLMLRCGLRVQEVADLSLDALDLRRKKIIVRGGKGGKDRIVYISNDTFDALVKYLRIRRNQRAKKVFLVEKGTYKGKPISVRGIQKRMEYYAGKSGLKISCHHLRHTMATQLLNADAALVTIQDLLGHTRIKTTQRYCSVSNLKVQRDYHNAMKIILQRTSGGI